MKISCIVTVYNRLEYLKNVIRCLQLQTRGIDELIIADDGSEENVFRVIQDFIPKCNFSIKHIYQKDAGFRKARSLNNAVREAKGELLIFLDQDVIFGKDYIKEIAQQLKKGRIAPLKVLWSTFDEKEKIQKKLNENVEYTEILKEISEVQKKDRKKQNRKDFIRSLRFKFKLRNKPLTVGGASYALFKEDYIKINGYDEEFKGHGNEDLDFGCRLQRSKVIVKIISLKEAPIHMAHSKDPTAGSNIKKFEETLKNENVNYCRYGYDNTLDQDIYEVKILKKLENRC